jgi:hypothetical protein
MTENIRFIGTVLLITAAILVGNEMWANRWRLDGSGVRICSFDGSRLQCSMMPPGTQVDDGGRR